MKIGVFGGTFNPIHYGHLRAAEEARMALSLDRVIFIPAGTPPLKSNDIANAAARLRMARIAISGNRHFEVLDVECSKPGKSYTVETLDILKKRFKTAALFFILGIDAFLDIPNWWRPDQLAAMTNFAVLSRPGFHFIDLISSPYLQVARKVLKNIDAKKTGLVTITLTTGSEAALIDIAPLSISSTDIRRRIRQGLSVKYMLPEKVESFIISNELYGYKTRRHKTEGGGTFRK